jgi:hypothetical protein
MWVRGARQALWALCGCCGRPSGAPVRNPRHRRIHSSRIHHEGHEEHEGRVGVMPVTRARCPKPGTPSPPERSVPNGDPTCRSPLRVLCFFVSFVLFVVRSGSPVRRPGLDEQDRPRPAAVVSLTEARRHGGRVVKPLPRRVSPGERDRGFRTDSAAWLPDPSSPSDAPCARWVLGSQRALRASVPP